jgi:thiol-disulfide isomerase/thioredoxin
VVCTVVAGLLLAGCSALDDPGSRVSTSAGAASGAGPGITLYPEGQRAEVPDLTGKTLSGTTFSLSALRGHVDVLNVWASWCEPCRTESPVLASAARATAGDGVRFVGLDEQDRADAAREFAASAGTTYPHVIDDNGTLLGSLRIVPSSGIPSTLVLDGSGRVAARVIGAVDAASFEALVRSVVTPSPGRTTS